MCLVAAVMLVSGSCANCTPQVKPDIEVNQCVTYEIDVNEFKNIVNTQVENKEIIEQEPELKTVSMQLPSQTDGRFKTYMSYRAITNKSSRQYKLQQQAWTDEKGFRRIGDDYMIALGSAYGTQIGDRYKIVLDSGVEFIGILGDCKANKHTNSTNMYAVKSKDIIEFIVDTNKMERLAKKMGDMSYSGFSGGVVSIERIISE